MQAPLVLVPSRLPPQPQGDRRAFEAQLLKIIPELRAFARFLTGSQHDADDLVQDTIIRALKAFQQFDLNTNIKAWCFTILRNLRINSFRKRHDDQLDDNMMTGMSVGPRQEHNLELKQVLSALAALTPIHREVLILVRASGLSYEEAAKVMRCKLGTIKSRVNRADAALRAALGPEFEAAPPVSTDRIRSPAQLK